MEVLVLGGTNFIGRHIASALADHHRVTVLNRGSREPVAGVAFHAIADRFDQSAVRDALRGRPRFDVVVDVSATEPGHVEGLLAGLADQAPSSYVLLSSAAVYSPGSSVPYVETLDAGGDPVWGGYGEAKAACERTVLSSGIENVTVLRPPYVYGPGNNEDREKWLWARAVARQPVFLPPTGTARIQFCHVAHLAGVVAAAASGMVPPGIFNVGESRAYTFVEYLAAIAEACGRPIETRDAPDESVPARSYFPFRNIDLYLDTGKLRDLGLSDGPDLAQGLSETWQWHLEHGLPDYEPTTQERAWLQ